MVIAVHVASRRWHMVPSALICVPFGRSFERIKHMKKCAYCGAEYSDDAVACGIDHTPFSDSSPDNKSAKSFDRGRVRRLRRIFHYTIAIIIVALLYLLSFGPVSRYCGVVVYQSSTPTTNIINGTKMASSSLVDVWYPYWVGIVYYPAVQIDSGRYSGGIYGRYINWWGLPVGTPSVALEPAATAP